MAEIINVNNGSRVEIQITDWRYLIRETRKIDPTLIKQFKMNALAIAKPIDKAIRYRIPYRSPISGMKPKVVPGRMTWGNYGPSNRTEIRVDTRIRKQGKSIVSVWVMSPATVMADMAAKVGDRSGKLTREYEYSRSATGTRRHRINGQGSAMVQALNKSHNFRKRQKASRMVWPAAEKALPSVNERVNQLINKMASTLNAEILRNAK